MACPHPVIGPVQTGSLLVSIDGKPAARVGDTGVHMSCCGPNTFTIITGDPEVLIDGRPAAKTDPVQGQTKHCGGVGSLIPA
ncbi:MAG: PAAR domain-containing protein [Candidatus Omnitrophica bacterium]|nr:PAAR domain-containing protein [Candidatus Omnitrophota bacterium]